MRIVLLIALLLSLLIAFLLPQQENLVEAKEPEPESTVVAETTPDLQSDTVVDDSTEESLSPEREVLNGKGSWLIIAAALLIFLALGKASPEC